MERQDPSTHEREEGPGHLQHDEEGPAARSSVEEDTMKGVADDAVKVVEGGEQQTENDGRRGEDSEDVEVVAVVVVTEEEEGKMGKHVTGEVQEGQPGEGEAKTTASAVHHEEEGDGDGRSCHQEAAAARKKKKKDRRIEDEEDEGHAAKTEHAAPSVRSEVGNASSSAAAQEHDIVGPLPPSPGQGGGGGGGRGEAGGRRGGPNTTRPASGPAESMLACPVCRAPLPPSALAPHARLCLEAELVRLLGGPVPREEDAPASSLRLSSSGTAHLMRTPGRSKRASTSSAQALITIPPPRVLSKRTSGLWDDVARAVGDLASDLGIEGRESEQAFFDRFRLSAIGGEKLLGMQKCMLIDGDAMVAGEAYIGKRHFAFASSNDKYKVILPYRSIVSIERVAAVMSEEDARVAVPSFVKPAPAAGLIADALRFRTTDRKVRVFWTHPLATAAKDARRSALIGKHNVWADLTCSTWSVSVRGTWGLSSSRRSAQLALDVSLASVITSLTASGALQTA